MGLDSSVGLIVATLDLQLVRLIRGAMRAAAGDCHRHLLHPEPVIEPRKRFHPEPVIEPRPHVHPEPAFEPRPVLRRADELPPACPPAEAAVPAEKSAAPTCPVQPPWKVLPWDDRMRGPRVVLRKIKVSPARPDSQCKGSVIDLFI